MKAEELIELYTAVQEVALLVLGMGLLIGILGLARMARKAWRKDADDGAMADAAVDDAGDAAGGGRGIVADRTGRQIAAALLSGEAGRRGARTKNVEPRPARGTEPRREVREVKHR